MVEKIYYNPRMPQINQSIQCNMHQRKQSINRTQHEYWTKITLGAMWVNILAQAQHSFKLDYNSCWTDDNTQTRLQSPQVNNK